MTDQLTPGAVFPDLTLNIAGGGTLKLPADLDSTYTVVLFYRGHW
jgi:peroxiredoxin